MREEQATIRVVVVDDHLIVREGLRFMLEEADEGFVLVGDAGDGAAALQVVGREQPDVVLMDLRMPGMDGLETIKRIRANWPHIAVLILTTYNEDDLMIRGLQMGACGYLLKETDRATLFRAIRAAARNEMTVQPEMMNRILSYASHGVSSPALSAIPSSRKETELTEREVEVLTGLVQGERNKEIALRLGVAERTVRAHLSAIYMKLNVDSRAQAVAHALQHGLIPPHPF
ncbi:DNA-binding response regulator [Ktedonobacter sp. SOSP1-52]|uniref:response regulator transcription factor n=1 Tax=Ktedonobacter sp. SOSP1-52 TaxID=2778366 RepID=UPI0019154C96|nr:response regulator transcription factor [Ktedonobacter sp. SOSP1-52]GHO72151.1 DNA-binding response regulator [Ktedonobacter sp. SOSP1-52]